MKLYESLIAQLKKDNNLISDSGDVKKWVVADKARNYDAELLALLLDNEDLKKTFFKDVNGTMVFLLEKFLLFIEQKNYLNDSYTAYRNKIGLTIGGRFLNQRNEVELVWPYKDCILEGGQTKEDQKRPEIFFNQTLAQDEITQLLDPKVLTNAKLYGKDGVHNVSTFTRDAELNEKRGLPKDTITDNLVIKGNNLLALHSLKREFAGKVKLIYIDVPYNTGNDSFGYNDSFSHSTWLTFMKNRIEVAKELLTSNGSIVVNLDWNEVHYCKILLDSIFGRDCFRNEIIWCYTGPGSPKMKQLNRKHDNLLWYSKDATEWAFYGDNVRMQSEVHVGGFNGEMSSSVSADYTEKGKIPEDWWELFHTDADVKSELEILFKDKSLVNNCDWWKEAVASRIRVDGRKRTGFLTEKPYKLMERIVKMLTKPNDIVLDFCAGSGTTGFVSEYLNRQFVLVEQMDGQIEIMEQRFAEKRYIYLELKKYNQTFIERIESAQDTETLLQIWEQMKEKSFLAYNIDIKTQEANMEQFKQLELAQQKAVLCELLDKNQLYVNVSDMNDERFETTDEERKVTEAFYSKK